MNSYRASQGVSRRGVRNIQRGRRQFLTVAGGTTAALFAAACGGNSNNAKPSGAATTAATRAAAAASSSAAAASTSTSAPAAVATTPSAPVKVSTVTYFGGDNAPEEVAWHTKFDADFTAAFPQYKVESAEYSATADFYPKLQTALATNSAPDLIFKNSAGQDLPTLWDQGVLAPVNDVMEDIYKAVGGKDKFSKASVDRFTLPTGELIGVPMLGNPHVMWYRADLFQAAGLTPPADGHWDWNFLLKAVKAVHKPPQVYGLAIPLGRTQSVYYDIGSHILGNGGHFVSQDLKDVVFDSPETRDALDLIKELSQYTPPGATTWGNPDQVNALSQGTCAMGQYAGRVFAEIFNKNPSLIGKMSNALMPYNKVPRAWGGTAAHGLLKVGKNLQGAKDLAKFSMTKEQYISFALTAPGFYSFAIPAYGIDPSYTNDKVLKAFDPKMLAIMSDTEKNFADFVSEGPGWKTNPKSGALAGSLFLADVVQKVVIGKESSQSAATFGAQQVRDIMKG